MPDSELRRLGDLFSDYRAEWSASLFADLFITKLVSVNELLRTIEELLEAPAREAA